MSGLPRFLHNLDCKMNELEDLSSQNILLPGSGNPRVNKLDHIPILSNADSSSKTRWSGKTGEESNSFLVEAISFGLASVHAYSFDTRGRMKMQFQRNLLIKSFQLDFQQKIGGLGSNSLSLDAVTSKQICELEIVSLPTGRFHCSTCLRHHGKREDRVFEARHPTSCSLSFPRSVSHSLIEPWTERKMETYVCSTAFSLFSSLRFLESCKGFTFLWPMQLP